MSVADDFNQGKRFANMIALHVQKEMTWDEAHERAPSFPKGWWEFSKLSKGIKREFIRDFWFNALPYLPHIYQFLDSFFAKVKEIGVYLAQDSKQEIFEPLLCYQLENQIFWGRPPLLEKERQTFKNKVQFPFPEDFLDFLCIHNGFSKGEETGIFSTHAMCKEDSVFRERLEQISKKIQLEGEEVDPQLLFPFYCSSCLDVYQCFYKDWYPDGEVGNVLCSLSKETLPSWNREETLTFSDLFRLVNFLLRVNCEKKAVPHSGSF